jgi:hypothetical protein
VHPQGHGGSSPDGHERVDGVPGRGTRGGRAPDSGRNPDRHRRADGWVDGNRSFTGGVALPPWTGTMLTMESRPLSVTSVLAVGGLPLPRPTTLSGQRW